MRYVNTLLCAGMLFFSMAQAQECNFYARTGAKVTPAGGECTIDGNPVARRERKSGLERCVHREDKRVLLEITWADGKREGAASYFDGNGRRIVVKFRNDLAEGPAQVFSKDNKLLCQMEFRDGKTQGAVRELYPSGKLKGAYEIVDNREGRARIELLEDGRIRALRCASRSMVPEDVVPCGFDGKVSRVQSHNNEGVAIRNVSYWQNGKLTKLETVDNQGRAMTRTYPQPGDDETYEAAVFHKNGKLFQSYGTVKNRLQGPLKEFSEEGTLLLETVYEHEAPVTQNQYFMNGKLKRGVKKTGDGKLLEVQEFWDNGKLKISGTFTEDSYRRGSWEHLSGEGRVMRYSKDGVLLEENNYRAGRYAGDQKAYYENGKLAVEERYENDKVRMTKCYDPSGKLELTEEYFEDGSLKAGSTQMSEKERAAKGICRVNR